MGKPSSPFAPRRLITSRNSVSAGWWCICCGIGWCTFIAPCGCIACGYWYAQFMIGENNTALLVAPFSLPFSAESVANSRTLVNSALLIYHISNRGSVIRLRTLPPAGFHFRCVITADLATTPAMRTRTEISTGVRERACVCYTCETTQERQLGERAGESLMRAALEGRQL